jgi:Amt family ammonium transporter
VQIAACSSGIVWLFISWAKNKPSTVALLNGVIAGLAGITPASGASPLHIRSFVRVIPRGVC